MNPERERTSIPGMRSVNSAVTVAIENTRFNIVMATAVVPMLVFDIVLAYLVHLDGAGTMKAVASVSVGNIGLWILAAAYWYSGWRDMTKLRDISQLAGWVLLVIPAISFLIPVAGRSPYPLVDSELALIDARLRFRTASVVHVMSRLPALRLSFAVAYVLLPLLVLAALLVPTLSGRPLDSRRFVLAVLFAAVLTAALFALWPAAGPWTVEGFAPRSDQTDVVSALALLKAGAPLPAGSKSAVVAFPSFHVILAVLSVIALWRVRWARWPAFILGTAICISTITTGWHYGIDVIGGLATTYVAHVIAKFALKPVAVPVESRIASADAEAAGTAF